MELGISAEQPPLPSDAKLFDSILEYHMYAKDRFVDYCEPVNNERPPEAFVALETALPDGVMYTRATRQSVQVMSVTQNGSRGCYEYRTDGNGNVCRYQLISPAGPDSELPAPVIPRSLTATEQLSDKPFGVVADGDEGEKVGPEEAALITDVVEKGAPPAVLLRDLLKHAVDHFEPVATSADLYSNYMTTAGRLSHHIGAACDEPDSTFVPVSPMYANAIKTGGFFWQAGPAWTAHVEACLLDGSIRDEPRVEIVCTGRLPQEGDTVDPYTLPTEADLRLDPAVPYGYPDISLLYEYDAGDGGMKCNLAWHTGNPADEYHMAVVPVGNNIDRLLRSVLARPEMLLSTDPPSSVEYST